MAWLWDSYWYAIHRKQKLRRKPESAGRKQSIICHLFWFDELHFHCCCYCSVPQSYQTVGNPMDWSTPGFNVLHHLPLLAQTHVHWVCDAIQPSCPLPPLSPSPPQSFPGSGSFLMMWPKYWSFSFSISSSNE